MFKFSSSPLSQLTESVRSTLIFSPVENENYSDAGIFLGMDETSPILDLKAIQQDEEDSFQSPGGDRELHVSLARRLNFSEMFSSDLTEKSISPSTPTSPVNSSIIGQLEDDDSGIFTQSINITPESQPVARKLSFADFSQEVQITQTNSDQPALSITKLSNNTTPVSSAKRNVYKSPEDNGCYITKKRSEKFTKFSKPEASSDSSQTAYDKEQLSDDLIGDFSSKHQLPVIEGKHKDLKFISPRTVADLMTGKLKISTSFKCIDCRYPYEYDGGHLEGALNLHTQDKLSAFLQEEQLNHAQRKQPTILIFHCEFSSERGPKRARFLRSFDRQVNAEHYPKLYFPEIYIMEGGYKAFYEQENVKLCSPQGYIPMLHKDYRTEMKTFRTKSKAWNSASGKSQSKMAKLQLKY